MAPRRAALDALSAVRRGVMAPKALDAAFQTSPVSAADHALAAELFYGVLRWRGRLIYLLAPHVNRPFAKLDPTIQDLLLLGAYQRLYLRIPDHASVAVTVELAKVRAGRASGLVNAVLRRLGTEVTGASPKAPETALAERLSHPEWLVKRWLERYGTTTTEAMLAFNQERPQLQLRVNKRRIERIDYIKRLEAAGHPAEATPASPLGVQLPPTPVMSLPGFTEGLFAVQSEASQLVALALEARPGEEIADLCAGLGGKSLALAEITSDQAHILATDMDDARLSILGREARRLRHESVTARRMDARSPDEMLWGRFQRVLVDAPCSGLGTVGRHPDIKWRRTPSDLPALARQQRAILSGAARLVRPGGVLLYAVCSLEPEEGPDVTSSFLTSAEGHFVDAPFEDDGRATRVLSPATGYDGFYMRRMKRAEGREVH